MPLKCSPWLSLQRKTKLGRFFNQIFHFYEVNLKSQFPQHRPSTNVPDLKVSGQLWLCSFWEIPHLLSWSNCEEEVTLRHPATVQTQGPGVQEVRGQLFRLTQGSFSLTRLEEFALHWRRTLAKQFPAQRLLSDRSLYPKFLLCALGLTTPIHLWRPHSNVPSSRSQRESFSCSSLLPFANCPHLTTKLKWLM